MTDDSFALHRGRRAGRGPVLSAARFATVLAAALTLGACATARLPGPGADPADPIAAPVPEPAPSASPAPAAVASPVPGPVHGPGPVEGGAPSAAPGEAFPLSTERQWLQSWFDGTPVVISQTGTGPLAVSVPLAFCFEAGSLDVQPPLAAVLDKVAESLRRHPRARLSQLAAPGDGEADSPLALQRATQVRTQLRLRGVRELQLGTASAATMAAVQLRVVLPPLP